MQYRLNNPLDLIILNAILQVLRMAGDFQLSRSLCSLQVSITIYSPLPISRSILHDLHKFILPMLNKSTFSVDNY